MFQIGQKVVCVKPPCGCRYGPVLPESGGVYTIRAIEDDGDGPCVLLAEVRNTPQLCWLDDDSRVYGEPNFEVWRFRPVKTTNIDVFQNLLAPAPSDVERV